VRIREASTEDLPFLLEMWHMAAFWQPEVFQLTVEEALNVPEVARYIEGFGREGDLGLVAEADGRPLAAAWYRSFDADEPGYGFVDEATPELAIAVAPHARRRGVATALLQALADAARSRGVLALSLSVNADNPSRRIYERAGFVDVREDDGSYVMLLRL
jgi:GNAT superfamily N-acetyltransferase